MSIEYLEAPSALEASLDRATVQLCPSNVRCKKLSLVFPYTSSRPFEIFMPRCRPFTISSLISRRSLQIDHRFNPILLCTLDRFEVRIEAMVLREEFFPSCAVMSHEIDVVRVATKGNDILHIHTVTCAQTGDPDIRAVRSGVQKVGMCHLRYGGVERQDCVIFLLLISIIIEIFHMLIIHFMNH